MLFRNLSKAPMLFERDCCCVRPESGGGLSPKNQPVSQFIQH